jgi:hypothetical protein
MLTRVLPFAGNGEKDAEAFLGDGSGPGKKINAFDVGHAAVRNDHVGLDVAKGEKGKDGGIKGYEIVGFVPERLAQGLKGFLIVIDGQNDFTHDINLLEIWVKRVKPRCLMAYQSATCMP